MNTHTTYIKGVIWFLISLVIGIGNDGLSKKLGQSLHPIEITFFRYFFSTLTLLPFMFYNGTKTFKTQRVPLHMVRGSILFLAIAVWCYGLTVAPIAVATVINFTIPLFTLVLAKLFLKEQVNRMRWFITFIGFIGIMIVLQPHLISFNYGMLLLLVASFLFASLDVINKNFIVKEGMLPMLFYTGLFTALLGIIPTIYVWQVPTAHQLGIFLCIGCGANLLLYCLLKGFSYADASALAPFRYTELLMSAAVGYSFFGEIPHWTTALGAAVIIPSTFCIMYSENRIIKQDKQNASV